VGKENLKPFKKGQSGNPKGRPKLPDLKEAIAKVLGDNNGDTSALDVIILALAKKAAKGDVRAAQELLDRGYGKSKQVIEGSMTTDTVVRIRKKEDANEDTSEV
jgi:hypothetical protein